MKRILLPLALLTLVAVGAQAQGAGLSQGEAEAFKDEFLSIKAEAEKGAELGIRYDAPSIEAITFTTSDGKTYRYGE